MKAEDEAHRYPIPLIEQAIAIKIPRDCFRSEALEKLIRTTAATA
jgi:hypothetical protein